MTLPELPPEVWLCIFHHASHVPGTLVPEIYAHVSLIGPAHAKTCGVALRETLVTTRAFVRVCKQWWHLASPYLYRSVYIGRARSLSSLCSTLVRSVEDKGTVVGTRPLGEYTQRLDIAIRDRAENPAAECDSIAALIRCMPNLTIISFAITSNYSVSDFPNYVLDGLKHSATSLRVIDWSSIRLEPSSAHIVNLLAKCTQLRILNCPRLVWSKELDHGGVPSTVTTLRTHSLIPVQVATTYKHLLPNFDPSEARRAGPTALQELVISLGRDVYYWQDLLTVYREQLVSVQFYIPSFYAANMESYLQILTRACPRLRRLTMASSHFSSFTCPRLVFPPIIYLGLMVSRTQLPKSDFKILFDLLEELRLTVPSLQVVQLLNDKNLHCMLKTHAKFSARVLQPFKEAASFRVEDREGVLLTDKLKILGSL